MYSRDFGLTETQRDIRTMAAEFVDQEIVRNVREWDRAERVDPGIVKKLGSGKPAALARAAAQGIQKGRRWPSTATRS